MTMALISVLATLAIVLALNWQRFQAMGSGAVLRMVLIWAVVFVALFLAVRLLGFA